MRLSRRVKRILWKIHDGIIYTLNGVAALGLILGAMAIDSECIVPMIVTSVCLGWLCLAGWANNHLENNRQKG